MPPILPPADMSSCRGSLLPTDSNRSGTERQSVCLQSVLSLARGMKLFSEERHAESGGQARMAAAQSCLASRRDALRDLAGGSKRTSVAEFIGLRNANMQSHLVVVLALFESHLAATGEIIELRGKRATGIQLDRLNSVPRQGLGFHAGHCC